ncbi:MAG: recombinase family protein [Acutalibacteraceae bacterium]
MNLRKREIERNKNVAFMSLKECIDTTTPQGQFMLTVFDALAQLERGCIRQRSCSGAREKCLNFFAF